VEPLGHRVVEALALRLALAVRIILDVVKVSAKAARVVWCDPLRDGSVQFGFIYACFPVIDHDEQVPALNRRLPRSGLGVLEKVAKIHQLPHIRDVFSKGLVQDQCPSVTGDLEGSIVLLLHDAGQCAEHGPHISPREIAGYGVLKDRLVCALMRSMQFRFHIFFSFTKMIRYPMAGNSDSGFASTFAQAIAR
jgi:hypothetical protein